MDGATEVGVPARRSHLSHLDELADKYIRTIGVAAIGIERGKPARIIVVADVGVDENPGLLCCMSRAWATVIAAEVRCYLNDDSSFETTRQIVTKVAAANNVTLTLHSDLVQRALKAVLGDEMRMVTDLRRGGGLERLNDDFKSERARTPKLRFDDYLHQRKLKMVESMVKRALRT